jgi:hypothetical protein
MALNEKIEAVKKISEALNDKAVNAQEQLERAAPNREHFQNLIDTSSVTAQPSFQKMDGTAVSTEGINPANNPVLAQEDVKVQGNGTATDQESRKKRTQTVEEEDVVVHGAKKPGSLMDEVRNLNTQVTNVSKLSPEDIKNQSKQLIAQIDTVKAQLAQASPDIKTSYQTLLRNRLTHIDDNLKIALSKAGVEYTAPTAAAQAGGTTNPIEKFIGYLTHSQYQLEHLNQTIESLNITNATLTPANMLALQIKVGYVQQQIELFTSLLNKALESTKTIMNVQV